MASILNEKKRKCDVLTNGPLPELGFITGPVYNCRLTTPQIIGLVRNGHRVYEIDPSNPSHKILLSMTNCEKPVFKAPVIETPVVSEPVVKLPETVVEPVASESGVTENNAHAEMLKRLGMTEDQWRHLSKSERRRLKVQSEHVPQTQNVDEQTKKSEESVEVASTPEVENEANVPDTTPVTHETVDEPVETSSVEEAVVSADM